MADNEKAQASSLPRIGELIDSATGIKYETYSADQKLGRTSEKPYNGVEAAVAALMDHPELPREKVYAQLRQQADQRSEAVAHDMKKQLHGETLDGLKPLQMKNGNVAVGGLFMSDLPAADDVRAQDKAAKATPEKVIADIKKLAIAHDIVVSDPGWKVAEGASNISNAIRDSEININGHALTGEQKKTMAKGLKAEESLERYLTTGKEHRFFGPSQQKEMQQLDAAMDTAATVAGIKFDDPSYKHYKEAMDKNIQDGLDAVKTLHGMGVKAADTDTGIPTHAGVPSSLEKGGSRGKS